MESIWPAACVPVQGSPGPGAMQARCGRVPRVRMRRGASRHKGEPLDTPSAHETWTALGCRVGAHGRGKGRVCVPASLAGRRRNERGWREERRYREYVTGSCRDFDFGVYGRRQGAVRPRSGLPGRSAGREVRGRGGATSLSRNGRQSIRGDRPGRRGCPPMAVRLQTKIGSECCSFGYCVARRQIQRILNDAFKKNTAPGTNKAENDIQGAFSSR
jgi:hypothetical protein